MAELEFVVLEEVVLSTGASSLVGLEVFVLEIIAEELTIGVVEFVFGATVAVVFAFVVSNVAVTPAVVVLEVFVVVVVVVVAATPAVVVLEVGAATTAEAKKKKKARI